MAYTRQYTQGVGWENEPSINTPISAENLNQMDEAIQDVDEATYNEFAAVYAAIAQAGGGRCFSDHIVSSSGARLNTSTNFLGDENFAEGDILFLYSEVDATNPDSNYTVSLGGTKLIGRLVDYRDGNDEAPFHEDIPAGTTLVITYTTDVLVKNLMLRAVIPAASSGGGGCRIFSDHITEQDDTNLYTSTNVFDGTTSQEGDLLFLRCDVDAVWPSPPLPLPGWGISFGHGSVEYGSIIDARRGEGSVMPGFYDSISSGTTLIISKHGNNGWWLRAVIPVASGGGTTVIANPSDPASSDLEKLQVGSTIYAINAGNSADGNKITSTSSSSGMNAFVTDISLDGGIAEHVNDVFFLTSECNTVASQYGWSVELRHTSGGGTFVVTQLPLFGIGATSLMDMFSGAIHTGDIIVAKLLYSDIVSDYALYMLAFDELPTLASLTDTNISTPSDGQFLKYDATSDKWINASGGGGGASSLASLSDTTISSPTAAQPLTYDATNSKWVNGGIIPAANGGTGNATGYVQAGRKANTSIGTGATAEGYQATASGNYSHAEGYQPTASGNYSHAEGSGTTASAPNSHAEGASTQATANSAHAEGNGSKATGTASHAENASNTASGSNSHAGGNNSTAGGTYSFVHGRDISIGTNGHYAAGFGQGTVANYSHQFVVGKYNNNKSTNIFEVGIGTGTGARANGLELDTSGNLTVAGTVTDGNGNNLSALASYLEQTVTLSTSASTTVTFTDSSITANSFIEYACSQWDLVPESITGAAGSCTIVLPKVESAQSVTVRIYVR